MKKTSLYVLFCGAALCVSTSHAGPTMQPGLWEVSTSMDMPGMPMQMPATTIKHCYTKEDVSDSSRMLPKDDKCTIRDYKVDGNKANWSVQCTGDTAVDGSGSVSFNNDSYNGNIKMLVKNGAETVQIMSKISARRVGNCVK